MQDLVFIIDADVRRRASISFYLNNEGIRAEPFETIEEFVSSWPRCGVVLMHDEAKAVSSLVQEICGRHSWLPIVAYSDSPQPSDIVEAVLEGAVGYAAWPGCGETLAKVLHGACNRSSALAASGSRQVLAAARIEKLSRREREIPAGMVEGLSNRLMGEYLGISPRTVELHRANLLEKIGAKHSAEAIRVAMEASLPAFRPAVVKIALVA